MGGRQVEAVIKTYLGAHRLARQQSQAQCSAYTQDEQVFAVVLDGGLQNNAIPCYAAANTLVLDETLIAHDTGQFEKNSPYLWSPTHPEYCGFMKAQLTAMNDGQVLRRQHRRAAHAVRRRGLAPHHRHDRQAVPRARSASPRSQTIVHRQHQHRHPRRDRRPRRSTAGKNGKLNRVVVVGGARIEPVVLSDPNANNYPSTWGISTYDNPTFIESNRDSIVTDAAQRHDRPRLRARRTTSYAEHERPGVPGPDEPVPAEVRTRSSPPPVPPRRRTCASNWKNALQYCDGALSSSRPSLDKLPGKARRSPATQFKDAAGQIGDTYRSSMTFGAAWGPGVYAGTNAGADAAVGRGDERVRLRRHDAAVRSGRPARRRPASARPRRRRREPGSVGTDADDRSSSVGTVPSTPASPAAAVDPLETHHRVRAVARDPARTHEGPAPTVRALSVS